MSISQLTGTPFHIGRFKRSEDDPRRHKSHCIHYRKSDKRCTFLNKICHSSSHCDFYSDTQVNSSYKVKEIKLGQQEDKKLELTHLPQKNDRRVIHKVFGEGVIRGKKNNGEVLIQFKEHGALLINLNICLAKNIITFIDSSSVEIKHSLEQNPMEKLLAKNKKLSHISMGSGEIIEVLQNGFVVVNFRKLGIKTINLEYCIENHIVSFV